MSKKISSRCWELVTDLKHPETGEQLVDISAIDSILQEHSQVISYGWIVHDKDLYTADDEAKNSEHKNGTLKNAHIHLVMKFTRAQELEALAKWFGFEEKEYFFEKKNNGRGKRDAYIDCLAYLTHEDEEQQNQGKYAISDKPFVTQEYMEELKKLNSLIDKFNELIKKEGININQMARIANTNGDLPTMGELEKISNEISKIRKGAEKIWQYIRSCLRQEQEPKAP